MTPATRGPTIDVERTLLDALRAEPTDVACWSALADWLEEAGQDRRAELLRLRLELQQAGTSSEGREQRLRQLLDEGVPPVVPTLTNSIGACLALIPAGSFRMGSPESEPDRHGDEGPPHAVTLTRPFYLGVHPVTQTQYVSVMGHNPSHFRAGGGGAPLVRGTDTSDFPVECVSWTDAVTFCARLSELPEEKAAGRVYRLPTEAEWEYACRAGTSTRFHYGDVLTADQANVDGNLSGRLAPDRRPPPRTCRVGQYSPNAFGLYDMHGNVWEWCSDWFGEDYYKRSPASDPTGPATGTRRSLRGGGWFYGARICRSAYRYRYEPEARHQEFGFRLALDA